MNKKSVQGTIDWKTKLALGLEQQELKILSKMNVTKPASKIQKTMLKSNKTIVALGL